MNQAYEIPSFYLGVLPADIDMSSESAYQFHCVGLHAAANTEGCNGAALTSMATANGPSIGILQNNPIVGEAGILMVHGVSKAAIGGTVAAGDLLMSNSSGQLVLCTTGNQAIAQALSAAVSGDIGTVLLVKHGKQ